MTEIKICPICKKPNRRGGVSKYCCEGCKNIAEAKRKRKNKEIKE